ncbi:hypothetical protein [Zhongshania sp.]|jgi:hypothetical protein|uniref:hypothetical protein n=1 Tax=Zhongshania sp. TaxID=1971902 RepID=UPI002A83AA19|nr:hypothetical protein [Zhongshania sp.]
MAWLIGFAVIGFMLAPIMWILPSRRQSQQAAVRAAARAHGLSVKVVAMPKSRRERVRREEDVFGVCYTRSVHNKKPLPAWKCWLLDIPEGEDDLEPCSPEILMLITECRNLLPNDATMLEFTPIGLHVYWRERQADEKVVADIALCLNTIIEKGRLEIAPR